MSKGKSLWSELHKKLFEKNSLILTVGILVTVSIGGIGAPSPICCAGAELLAGANHAFQMLVGLVPGAIGVIERFGTQAQQDALIPELTAGTTLATMCLTEADAGSDLGAIRTSGTRNEAGDWTLSGEKIFISGGDQDLSDAIVHLVLAHQPKA